MGFLCTVAVNYTGDQMTWPREILYLSKSLQLVVALEDPYCSFFLTSLSLKYKTKVGHDELI